MSDDTGRFAGQKGGRSSAWACSIDSLKTARALAHLLPADGKTTSGPIRHLPPRCQSTRRGRPCFWSAVGMPYFFANAFSALRAGFIRPASALASPARIAAAASSRSAHTLGPPTPRFCPKLSAVSQSHSAWVKRGWLRSFGRNLAGLASEREGSARRKPEGYVRQLASRVQVHIKENTRFRIL